jgi:hypothetical protein
MGGDPLVEKQCARAAYRRRVKLDVADFPSGLTTRIVTLVRLGKRVARLVPVSTRRELLSRRVPGHGCPSLPMNTVTPVWKFAPVISIANGSLCARIRVMIGAAVTTADTTMFPLRTLVTPFADAVIVHAKVPADAYVWVAFCDTACAVPSPNAQS